MKKNTSQRFSPKPKKRNSNKKAKPQNPNKQKGKLLKRAGVALYKSPGIKIKTSVDYPTTDVLGSQPPSVSGALKKQKRNFGDVKGSLLSKFALMIGR